jgi:DNA-binding protein YbaB
VTGLADSLVARTIQQRNLLQAMDEHCQSLRARVTSRDGNVSVEVDGRCAMTGLWLAPSSYQLGAEALAQLVVDTARAAASVVVRRQNGLTEEFAARMRALQEVPLKDWNGEVLGMNASDGEY